MSLFSQVKRYRGKYMGEIRSIRINSGNDTVIQVQLVPPHFYLPNVDSNDEATENYPYLALINGENRFVLKMSDAILLNEFCMQLNQIDFETSVPDKKELETIIEKTVSNVYKVYFKHVPQELALELDYLIKLFSTIDYKDDVYRITEFEREVAKES